jgi:hypothetical protein
MSVDVAGEDQQFGIDGGFGLDTRFPDTGPTATNTHRQPVP